MDDLLVGGSDDDGHLKNLEAVLCQFQKYGLRVKLPRCVFMAQSVIYFGFRFSEKGSSDRLRKGQGHQGSTCPNQLHPQVIDPCPSFAPRKQVVELVAELRKGLL